MQDDYASIWGIRLQWAYLLAVVFVLMVPVFYNLYISFNEFGFGAARYKFTLDWYGVIFTDRLLTGAMGWTMALALVTVIFVVPMGLLTAKLFKQAGQRLKLTVVSVMLLPLFVPADIFASALLVFFKQLNGIFQAVADVTGIAAFETWFELGFMTAVIGLIIYTIPYVFIVILITMGRYRVEQTEAARSCGATAWRAFWDVEFPQIRAGVFSSCAFTVILSFNEYVRTSTLKGGFDTFTSVLISQMLNTGMSEQSYAMGGLVSAVAILTIGSIIVFTLVRTDRLQRLERAKAQPVGAD